MASTDLNDSLASFLQLWEGSLPSLDLPKAYLTFALDLMRGDEELVRRIIKLLTQNITAWAKQHSPVYENFDDIIDKSHLEDKTPWYIPDLLSDSQPMHTNGSTTGEPFHYLRWESTLRPIEVTNHYKMILQEFDMPEKPKVLYLLLNIWKTGRPITVLPSSPNFAEKHGADEAEVHFAENTDLYKQDRDVFYKVIVKHLMLHPVDVILGNGATINSLTNAIKRLGVRQKLAHLLSNTCEMMIYEDVEWLQDNGIVVDACDHMRCWDGGASFFTCKIGRYHLMDNLAYCYSDGKRLISTDYFSFPSPFVNYWNGDYAYIEDDYKRCGCGRLYREFQFLQNRPFSLKGRTIATWRDQIMASGIEIKQVKCDIDRIEVITEEELTPCEENTIRDIMKGFVVVLRRT